MKLTKEINPYIFREYDIRGKYPTDINKDIAYTIGRSFASRLIDLGKNRCIVSRDNRLSSPMLSKALIEGILESGIDVIDLGTTTTPMYYYACINQKIYQGIMVTASHNPKDENGFKIAFDETGNACGKTIQDFLQYTLNQNFHEGKGRLYTLDIKDVYNQVLLSGIKMGPRRLKVIVDCGNGTTSLFAKEIYEKLPIDLEVLFGESDASFPNHHPDPSVEENLSFLKQKVLETKADVGLAFDGDGDRLGVVDNLGRFVPMDLYMVLIARNLLPKSTNKKILYDVKCSRNLVKEIERLGGEALCSRVGNSYTKRYTKEWDCIFGGELSGHVYFRDKFYGFDSGMYAGLRLLEILSWTNQSVSELLGGLDTLYATPEIKVPISDAIKFEVVEEVRKYVEAKQYPYNPIDGVRVDLENAFVLVRASNTGPNLTLRVEATTEEEKDKLLTEFTSFINQKIEERKGKI